MPEGRCPVNWTEIILGVGTAVASLGGGVLIGRHLLGKPPAPRAEWDRIREENARKRREALETEAQRVITPKHGK